MQKRYYLSYFKETLGHYANHVITTLNTQMMVHILIQHSFIVANVQTL